MEKQIVLLVEDQKKMADIVIRILQKEGFEVIYAPNGVVALELAMQTKPNIVLCDINMPEMDGYDFFKHFKATNNSINVPFLFLTANSSYTDLRNGMNLGADDYLTKPISRKDLLNAITVRLHKKTALEQEIEKLTEKYAEEIAKKDSCLDEIGWNESHLLRAPIANLMAIVDLLDKSNLNEKNTQLIALIKPITQKLDDAIRENVLKINGVVNKDSK